MSDKEKEQFNFELKAIAKSSILVFVFLVFSKIVAYIYRLVLARYFGPEIYGAFSLAVMVSGIFVLFSVLGFDEGLLRFIPFYRGKKDYRKISELFNFSIKIVSGLSIVFWGIMFFSSGFLAEKVFHDSNLKIFFQIFAFSIPFAANFRIYASSLKAYEKVGLSSFLTNFLDGGSKLLFLVSFLFLGFEALSIHISYVFSWIVMLIFAYFVFNHYTKIKIKKSSKKGRSSKKEFINYSWPLLFTFLIGTLFSWTDVFFIGFFKSTYEVGIYSSAIPIAALLFFIPSLFVQLFAPMINRNYSENKIDLIKNLSQQIGKWIFILNLPILIIMLFFPGVLVNLLFGGEYILATSSLIFLSIGYFFYIQFVTSFYLLNMLGKSKMSLLNTLIAELINIALNGILIPKYGIEGAAFSTMFAFIVMALLTVFEVYYFIKIIPLRRKIIRISLVGVISAILIFLIRHFLEVNKFSIILVGISFILLYFALIFLTKSLDKNDFMILRTIKGKVGL